MSALTNTLHRLTDVLKQYGSKTAIIEFGESDTIYRCTFEELSSHMNSLARGIGAGMIQKGDRVGLIARPSIQTTTIALALIRAGAVLVPIDRQLDDDSLEHIIDDAALRLIIADDSSFEKIEQLSLKSTPELIRLDETDTYRHPTGELPSLEPDDVAVLFYTSGTTGPSKGVPLSAQNIAFQLETVANAKLINRDDRVLLPLPLHHVYPLFIGLFAPLSLGVCVIFPHTITGPHLMRAIKEGDARVIIGVPRLYRAFYENIEHSLQEYKGPAGIALRTGLKVSMVLRKRFNTGIGAIFLQPLRRRIGPHLRVTASGGSALSKELFLKLESLGFTVAAGYGLTETSPLLTLNLPSMAKPGSAGRIIDKVGLRIHKSNSPESVTGQGEIQVQGPNVFKGYRNLDEETKKAFTPDGWFRTGDLGYVDNHGFLFITGRISTVMVTESGENIQPDEIEEWYEKHRFIEEAGVLMREGKLSAVVVPDIGAITGHGMPAGEAIREAMEEQSKNLPTYKRIAQYVISRENLPRTRLGKIRRHLLDEHYSRAEKSRESPLPHAGPIPIEEMSSDDKALLENPASHTAWEILARRFSDFPLTPDTSPQIDLGIDSLGWLEITLDISEKTGVEIDEQAIGRIETVRDLLREIAGQTRSGAQQGGDPFRAPEQLLNATERHWLRPHTPATEACAHGLYLFNRTLMRALFSMRTEGIDNLYEAGQCIITPNHISYIDSFVIAAILPYDYLKGCAWAAGVEVAFRNPLFRFVSRLAYALPIEHGRNARKDMALAAAAIDRKRNLIWYPEGRRETSREFLPFRPGLGLVLEHRPLPIVPVIIKGTERAMPIGRAIPRPTTIKVTFGKPILPDALQDKAHPEDGREDGRRYVEGLKSVMEEMMVRQG
ncbi:MAG: AMP-binding protein [Chitinivibrionales bacterium]|nr:AMP-binding protein [Chitinivibrionales bacterium]